MPPLSSCDPRPRAGLETWGELYSWPSFLLFIAVYSQELRALSLLAKQTWSEMFGIFLNCCWGGLGRVRVLAFSEVSRALQGAQTLGCCRPQSSVNFSARSGTCPRRPPVKHFDIRFLRILRKLFIFQSLQVSAI